MVVIRYRQNSRLFALARIHGNGENLLEGRVVGGINEQSAVCLNMDSILADEYKVTGFSHTQLHVADCLSNYLRFALDASSNSAGMKKRRGLR